MTTAASAKWKKAHPEKVREQWRRYRLRHGAEARSRTKKWRDRNREHLREYERRRYEVEGMKMRERLRVDRQRRPEVFRQRDRTMQLKQYGLTRDDYARMLEAQHGACAICGGLPSGRGKSGQRLHVDHDHITKKNRALLCERCNISIGKFDDSPVLLHAAALYIENWRLSHARAG